MGEYIKELCNVSNSIDIKALIPQSSANVFHYTSPAGLNSIISNGTLRFSDRYYMNDASEGKYVIELCIKHIDELGISMESFKKAFLHECTERLAKPQRDNFYVFQCSFSLDSDSLCLWNYYTKGDSAKGYNIAFEAKKLLKTLLPTPLEADGKCSKAIGGKVVYSTKEQVKIVKRIITQFIALSEKKDYCRYEKMTVSLMLDKIVFAGIFFKSDCFSVENEYRIAFNLFLQEDGKYATIKEPQKFREKNGIFIPYVDITFDKTTLKQITISPTLEMESTTQSLRRILKNGYSGLNGGNGIVSSKIPIRY